MGNLTLMQILVTLLLVILAGIGGFFLGASFIKQPLPSKTVSSVPQEKFLSAQLANFEGKILKKNNTSLTVESNKGEKATLALVKDFSVYKFDEKTRDTKEYRGLDKIELNKQVHMMLRLQNGEYQVASITYIPQPQANNK